MGQKQSFVRGFSFIEVMVVLAITIGLLVAVVPLGKTYFVSNKIEGRVNTILNAIKFAQNQAIILNKSVVLSEYSRDKGWSSGMRLYIDINQNRRFDEGDVLIREWHWGLGAPTIQWKGFLSDHYMLFSRQLNQSALTGHFIVSRANEKDGKKIIVNRMGRTRIEDV